MNGLWARRKSWAAPVLASGLCMLPAWAAGAVPKASEHSGSARELLTQALDHAGGEEVLRSLQRVRFRATRVDHWTDQPARGGGLAPLRTAEMTEIHDYPGQRLRREVVGRVFDGESREIWTVAGGVAARARKFTGWNPPLSPGTPATAAPLVLAPWRVLLEAGDAADLRRLPDGELDGVPKHRLAFSKDGLRVELLLDRDGAGLAAIDACEEYLYDELHFWGDSRARIRFDAWNMMPDRLLLPYRWSVEANGDRVEDIVLSDLDRNPDLADSLFVVPLQVAASYRDKVARPEKEQLEADGKVPYRIAGGILMIPGGWNVTVVPQADGLVVFEAPSSSEYSVLVLQEIARQFPGQRIKALLLTAHMPYYNAGVREYVARGVPVYCMPSAAPVVRRLIAQEHASRPDALQRRPQAAALRMVTQRFTLGSGENRIEVFASSRGSERMTLYFPEHKLLYFSDHYSDRRMVEHVRTAGRGLPLEAWNLFDLPAALQIDVEQAYGMHFLPQPWAEYRTPLAGYFDASRLTPVSTSPSPKE